MSSTWGATLLDHYGVRTTEPCNFDVLPSLIIFGRMVIPCILIPLTCLLIPNIGLDENLTNIVDDDDNPTGAIDSGLSDNHRDDFYGIFFICIQDIFYEPPFGAFLV